MRMWLIRQICVTCTCLHAKRSATKYNYISGSSGKRGLSYFYSVNQNNSTVELCIDRGGDSKEENERIFDLLKESKENIENVFSEQLDWEKLETKRACRIIKRFSLGGYRSDEEQWPSIHDKMIDAMIKLEKALGPHIKKLKIKA